MAISKLIKTAVPKNVMSLLDRMMRDDQFNRFYLVGGTSLALQIGHRISVDIDLFVPEDFDVDFIAETLHRQYAAQSLEKEKNTVRAVIHDVKVDLIAHKYPLIEPIETFDSIRIAGLKDIAAMKINAISNRGAKKDFWDYAALLDHFTTAEMLSFFEKKYPAANAWHVEKSLSFFDDSENDPNPNDLSGKTWSEIKQRVLSSLKI